MTDIRYALLAEGRAEEGLIPEILRQMTPNGYRWVVSSIQNRNKSNKSSKYYIIKHLEELIEAAIIRNRNQLVIAGVDLDAPDHTLEKWQQEKDNLQRRIPALAAGKVVLFIPIQAIDYWLLYLHDPSIPANGAESREKEEVKKAVYGTFRDGTSMKRRAAELAGKDNAVQILKEKSRSFKAFYSDMQQVIARFPL